MSNLKNVYQTIKYRSSEFKSNGAHWKKELSSAKNYVPTPDFKHWAFAKSAGFNNEYFNGGGGAAKKWFISRGFINVLDLPKSSFKNDIVTKFYDWARKIQSFDIIGKFERDQKNHKNFEFLIPTSIVPKHLLPSSFAASSQDKFDEGFKQQIIREVSKRDRKLIALAKETYGIKCFVCEFDFGQYYGDHGLGFIEVHHLFPIADGPRESNVKDVRPVCSNCHRMLHRGSSMLEIDELKEIIAKAKNIK